ncbi:MAG: Asp-tRNA(Asn)/Glu-tRNA(Gln) amidotransferase subunit GatA [Candidatus Komeilibacteria bacterium]|nr:Asp-tRNA(Asn)/Glu-tRNA(Gln) amidotransferase subunit GatA [Candidatus Komeilibacteria bacterium]
MTTLIPEKATIAELAEGLRSRRFSAVELTGHYLNEIKRDTNNAFITVNETASTQARAADELLASGQAGPLAGIPVAIKDVLATRGLKTTAGSKMLAEYVPSYTATAVQRLLDTGMVLLGKTNCDEFAMGSSNENSAFGPVKNPYDDTRVSGGSSGGSAVAVASGLAPVALGTDTGGSVRLPASFCGVVGLKPTYGRISRYGLIAMASSLDHVGIFSRTAADAALLLNAMAGHDLHDATSGREPVPSYADMISRELPKLRIGVPREYLQDANPLVEKLLQDAQEVYGRNSEIEFVDVSIPRLPYALSVYYICASSEVSANLARYDGLRYGFHAEIEGSLEDTYRHNRSALGPEVRRRIMLGTFALSSGYYDAYYHKAMQVRQLLRDDFIAAFKKADVLLCPASPAPAFKIGEKISDPLTMYLSDMYMTAANLVGIPAVAFPTGLVDGLPVGLQFMAPAWSEATLLALVHRFETASR